MAELDRLIISHLEGKLSRRALVHRLLALGIGFDFIETLLGQGTKRALAAAELQPAAARMPSVVFIVLDAFCADYVGLAPMPNLEWLMSRGTNFPNAWVGQLESFTPASHATLATGTTPSRHGVIGFEWRDAKTGKQDLTAWYNDVIAGRLEKQLAQHHVDSIAGAVKRANPKARIVALSSEKYYAADAFGGPAADVIMYGISQGKTIVTKGIPHHLPPAKFLRTKGLTRAWPLYEAQYDEMAATMAIDSLRALNPTVLMVNMPGADVYGHRVGGPATPAVMAKIVAGADAQIGRLINAYRSRGILDQTIFVVVADHGMVPNTYQFRDTVVKEAVRAAGGDSLFQTGGSAVFIWLRNPEAAPQVAAHLVTAVPHVPVAHYQTLRSGVYTHVPVVPPGTTLDPALAAAYQYLLGTFAGPIAPDITLTLEANTIIRNRIQGPASSPHGNHGGGTWGDQHIPLVIAGPGVRSGFTSGFPIRLMDVAPTLLALLGVDPSRMNGVVAADALKSPTAAQIARQDDAAPALTAYQGALRARWTADLTAASH